MKRLTTPLAVIAALAIGLVVSCDEAGLRGIDILRVNVDSDRQTVPGLLPIPCDLEQLGDILPGLLLPLTINLRGEEELEGHDVIGEFKSVKLVRVKLSIVDVPAGDTDNWDFVDSIRFYADDPSTPLEPRVLVAELDPVPSGETVIDVPGTGVDISDIASADTFTVSGEVTGRIPCDEVHFVAKAEFDVELF